MSKIMLAISFLCLTIILAACSSESITTPIPSLTASTSPLPPQIANNTPSPVEAIVLVNGESINSDSYELSLSLYLAALDENGTFLATDGVEQVVLDDLIARMLLAQAARAAGFVATEALLDERLSKLIDDAGGQSAYVEWLSAKGFSQESFQRELTVEMEAAWMRSEIIMPVPTHGEQIEARQILLTEEFQAERLYSQLTSGTPFETVVINNDPQRLGYLGWFPMGFLLHPEVEAAAFALQAGEFSQIVESELGYHLIEVIDRDSNRELSPQARLELQRQALAEWIADQRQQSEIEVLLSQ